MITKALDRLRETSGLVYVVLIALIYMQAIFQNKNIPFPMSYESAFPLFFATAFYTLFYYSADAFVARHKNCQHSTFFCSGLSMGFIASAVNVLSPEIKTGLISVAIGIVFLLGFLSAACYEKFKTEIFSAQYRITSIKFVDTKSGQRILRILQMVLGIFFGLAPYYIINFYVRTGWSSFWSFFLIWGIFLSGAVIGTIFFFFVFGLFDFIESNF